MGVTTYEFIKKYGELYLTYHYKPSVSKALGPSVSEIHVFFV